MWISVNSSLPEDISFHNKSLKVLVPVSPAMTKCSNSLSSAKSKDTVNYAWFMVNYAWFMVNYAWFMVNYAWFMVNYARFMVNFAWFMVNYAWFMVKYAWFMVNFAWLMVNYASRLTLTTCWEDPADNKFMMFFFFVFFFSENRIWHFIQIVSKGCVLCWTYCVLAYMDKRLLKYLHFNGISDRTKPGLCTKSHNLERFHLIRAKTTQIWKSM